MGHSNPGKYVHFASFYCQGLWLLRGAVQVVLVVKIPPPNAGDVRDEDLIPCSRSSPGRRHRNPLQYSCLENPMDGEAWWLTIHSTAKSWTGLK